MKIRIPTCGTYVRDEEFLRQWNLQPRLVVDGGSDFLEVELPQHWQQAERDAFQAALAGRRPYDLRECLEEGSHVVAERPAGGSERVVVRSVLTDRTIGEMTEVEWTGVAEAGGGRYLLSVDWRGQDERQNLVFETKDHLLAYFKEQYESSGDIVHYWLLHVLLDSPPSDAGTAPRAVSNDVAGPVLPSPYKFAPPEDMKSVIVSPFEAELLAIHWFGVIDALNRSEADDLTSMIEYRRAWYAAQRINALAASGLLAPERRAELERIHLPIFTAWKAGQLDLNEGGDEAIQD